VWECGVYRGDTSAELSRLTHTLQCPLRLFDTFKGRPPITSEDGTGPKTDFADTSLELAQVSVGTAHPQVYWHVGTIPATFVGLEESKIAFAYVDLDLFQSTYDALRFILPRLLPGGVVLVDDYLAEDTWPGVRRATDLLVPSSRIAIMGARAAIAGD
jgi:O-methyltransferase